MFLPDRKKLSCEIRATDDFSSRISFIPQRRDCHLNFDRICKKIFFQLFSLRYHANEIILRKKFLQFCANVSKISAKANIFSQDTYTTLRKLIYF